MIRKEVTIGDCRLILGNCLEVLPLLDKVDHIISDPPFEAEAHTLQRRVRRGVEQLDFAPITEVQRDSLSRWAATNCGGWILAFCQVEAVALWRYHLEQAGCRYRRAMVWVKPDGMPQYSGDRPGMGYESIVAAWCGVGPSVWNAGGKRGVYIHNKGEGNIGKNPHPTMKPISLMRVLVDDFTRHGDTIFDPFMGSGSTGVACAMMGRSFIGIELDEGYFNIACERIRRAYGQLDLFIDYRAPRVPQAVQQAFLLEAAE
jgi:site-specific DNA-methyltransferase (adenine-specific)